MEPRRKFTVPHLPLSCPAPKLTVAMPEPESVKLIVPTADPSFQPQYELGYNAHHPLVDGRNTRESTPDVQSKDHPVASMAALEVAIPEFGSVLEPHTG